MGVEKFAAVAHVLIIIIIAVLAAFSVPYYHPGDILAIIFSMVFTTIAVLMTLLAVDIWRNEV